MKITCKECIYWHPTKPRAEAFAGDCLRESGSRTASVNGCPRWASTDDPGGRAWLKGKLVVSCLSGSCAADVVEEVFVTHDLKGA